VIHFVSQLDGSDANQQLFVEVVEVIDAKYNRENLRTVKEAG